MLTQRDHVKFLYKMQMIFFYIFVLLFVGIPTILHLGHRLTDQEQIAMYLISFALFVYVVSEIIKLFNNIKSSQDIISINDSNLSRGFDGISIKLNNKVIARKSFTYSNYIKPMFISKSRLALLVISLPITFPVFLFIFISCIVAKIIYTKLIIKSKEILQLFDCLVVYDCRHAITIYIHDKKFKSDIFEILKERNVSIKSSVFNCLPERSCDK